MDTCSLLINPNEAGNEKFHQAMQTLAGRFGYKVWMRTGGHAGYVFGITHASAEDQPDRWYSPAEAIIKLSEVVK